MANLNQLKQAIRNGDNEKVDELLDEGDFSDNELNVALKLAKMLNKVQGQRGEWDEIVESIENALE